MQNKTKLGQQWAVASVALQDAYTDFILSRQAMMCTPGTIRFYNYTAGRFVHWGEQNGDVEPSEISARYIRAYLSTLVEGDHSDSYINGHARAIKTFVKFLCEEEYLDKEPKFQMPSIAKKRLSVLTGTELRKVLGVCETNRDMTLVMLMVDTGLRRAELCDLNWEDIDLSSGLIRIRKGKGGKARSVVIGVKTRRALLKYRRGVDSSGQAPAIQTLHGSRLTHSGLRSALLRISDRAGVRITPHTLRRTFATLSLRAGMSPLHLQGLLGHSSLEMTNHYVQMLEGDLHSAHKEFGPIDNNID